MNKIELGPGPNAPDLIHVVIEIPAHADPVKYEMDKSTGLLCVDRFIETPMRYPCNYGYIPNTLADDHDATDVLVLTPFPLIHGCLIVCRPIGLLAMTDESGNDAKILAVPMNKLSTLYQHIQHPDDLPIASRDAIVHFFSHYKDFEPHKWVKLNGWHDADTAKKTIQCDIERYNKRS